MVQRVQTFPKSHCHLFHYLSIIFTGFNNDVALDGMVINLSSLLAQIVMNPFGNGYFQGPNEVPLEAAFVVLGFLTLPNYVTVLMKSKIGGLGQLDMLL